LTRARRSGREKAGVKFRRIPTAVAAIDFASVFAYTPTPTHTHARGWVQWRRKGGSEI